MLTTAAAALGNFLPGLQIPTVWVACSVTALLLARTLPTVRSALRKTKATKESALQIQSLLVEEVHGEQAFAFKVSKFQPKMRLRIATISKDNRVSIRTYSVAPGTPPTLKVEDRQIYVKRWLTRTYGDKWNQLALDRRISVPRARNPQFKFGTAPATPMD